MATTDDREVALAAALAGAWTSVERRLTGNLGAIRGISYSEFRLLSALADAGPRGLSRVDLGRQVGLTPSAVTRALQPLTKLGMVTTTKDARDARRAMAQLTPAGHEVVTDAAGVVRDAMLQLAERTPLASDQRDQLMAMLTELATA